LGFLRICYVSQCCRNQFIRARFLCLFCLLSLSLPLSAQQKLHPVFHFNRLTTSDGLSSNNVLSRALRDSRGYLWIGMGNGLSRYDGYGFTIYRNALDDSTSISSSMIFMVKEDSKHRLWVGSWDAGLSLYDPTRDWDALPATCARTITEPQSPSPGLFLGHFQPLFTPDALHTLVVHMPALTSQQCRHLLVSIAVVRAKFAQTRGEESETLFH
jgi:hypothetical protein